MKTVEATEDFGNMMISAVRYGLWRRTYITGMTSGFIVPLVKGDYFSPRTLTVLDRDLTQYEEDRTERIRANKEDSGERWRIDDDCDFQAWSALHKAVCDKIKEMKENGLWP